MTKIKVGDRVEIEECVNNEPSHIGKEGVVKTIRIEYEVESETSANNCCATKVRLLRACPERSRGAKSRSKLKPERRKNG